MPEREELITEYMAETLCDRKEAEWAVDKILMPAFNEIIKSARRGLELTALHHFRPHGRAN